MSHLKPRTQVPNLTVETLDGETWRLSDQSPENFTLILFYRGYHCPVCRMQLRDLDRNLAELDELGVTVLAVSSNPRNLAERAKKEWEVENVTIGYGLSLETAREWGLYVSSAIKDSEPDQFSEPGLFVMRPDGTLYASVVQTMPFARPSTRQLIDMVKYVLKNDYPARGEV